jgi:hypothetical protein
MEVLKLKEITMTFQEFFSNDEELKTLDKICGEILNNKKLKMAVLTSIAYTNMQLSVYASEMDQLRNAKNEIVGVLQVCICIICIVMCLLEIGKSLIGGRQSDISSIVMKYGSAVVGVCLVPKVFTWIAKLCQITI